MYDTYISMGDYICVSPMKAGIKLKDEKWGYNLAEFLKKCDQNLAILASGSSYNAAILVKQLYAKHLKIHVDVIRLNSFVNCDNESYDKYIVLSLDAKEASFELAINKLEANQKDYIIVCDDEKHKKSEKHEFLDVHDEMIPFTTIGFSFELFMLYKALYMALDLDMQDLSKALTVNQKAIFDAECYAKEHTELTEIKRLNVVASEKLLGLANEVAKKFKESMLVASASFEIEDFINSATMGIAEDDYVFLIADNTNLAICQKLVENLNVLTEHVYLFDFSEKIESDLLALAMTPYFQIICFEMNFRNGNLIPIVNDKYTEFKTAFNN